MTDIWSRCVYEISTDTRSIVYRSLDRLATEYRPTLDRLSTNSRPTLDRLSTDSRPTVDRLSTDYRSSVDRLSTNVAVDTAVDTTSTLPTVNMIQERSVSSQNTNEKTTAGVSVTVSPHVENPKNYASQDEIYS